MLKTLKKAEMKKLLPVRDSSSHKGDNGRVMIVGGSVDYHGAAILAGLGALRSGADLVYLYVPECNFDCTRSMFPDFIVKKYSGDYLTPRYVSEIVAFGRECDSVVIGPGLGDRDSTLEAVAEIVKSMTIPTVLDAEAISVLRSIDALPLPQPVVITPHRGEFKNLVDREIEVHEADMKSIILVRSLSMDLNINVLLKGPSDYVSSIEGDVQVNNTGNAGMSVGGTGDVLAGVVGTFLAQGMEAYDAARCAAFFNGAAGDLVMKHKGMRFTASDVAEALPVVLK